MVKMQEYKIRRPNWGRLKLNEIFYGKKREKIRIIKLPNKFT